ncbi:MAG TPA: homoserine kinase [Solirubrobacteraceae bacterium]|nr:homoserine kinase [Solirubrobacteraceae bacterium]
MRSVRVLVPGSTANLGPGFDVLAAALSLHVDLEVAETGEFGIVTELNLRPDRRNLIVRAFEMIHPADGFEFRVGSTIPLSGGMGSSAAGVVAGLVAAQRLVGGEHNLLALATQLEGHPDNVAASLYGGLVICDGPQVTRVDMPQDLEAVLVVPEIPVKTALARQALPPEVPLADAVHNLAQISKLTLGLARADWDLIAAGLGDRLHQPYRAHLYPASAAIIEHARDFGALGATISGAGPTVLVWCRPGSSGPVMGWLDQRAQGWARVLRVRFEPQGARVVAT